MLDVKLIDELKKMGIYVPEDANDDSDNTVIFLKLVLKTYEREMKSVLSEEEQVEMHALIEKNIKSIETGEHENA